MFRTGFAMLCVIFFACTNSDRKDNKSEAETEQNTLVNSFHKVSPPYQLSDHDLNKPDTAVVNSSAISGFIPDSIKNIFGQSAKFKYVPLARIDAPKAETYLIVKIEGGSKKGAVIIVLDKDKKSSAALPFLIPDDDPTTSQLSSIDANYSISRSINRSKGADITAEGKDVFYYDRGTKKFSWLLRDLLDESQRITNPIDTLSRHNKLSGDYVKDKKNIVSVRDGRYANQLIVFIHTEKEDEGCRGELKGEFLITSPTTAIFRHSGDPCVLQLTFTASSVSLHEEQGCGDHRDLNCPFEGSFARKKEMKKKAKK